MILVIGNKNYSSWSLRPWLLLSEFNIKFEEVQELLGQENIRERLARYSPSCKVPVLIDNGITIWDSLAICEYISETYLDGKGWPEDAGNRARARSISAEMHSGFFGIRNELPLNCRARKKVAISETILEEIRRIDQIWSDCRKTFNTDGPWLFGGFTIADCMYAPVALRFQTYGVDISITAREYMNTMIENQHITDWMAAARQETEFQSKYEIGEDINR